MSDRKIAKTFYGKFRKHTTSPLSDHRIVDIIVEAIQAEREQCAKRVEAEALSDNTGDLQDLGYNYGIEDAAAAVRNA